MPLSPEDQDKAAQRAQQKSADLQRQLQRIVVMYDEATELLDKIDGSGKQFRNKINRNRKIFDEARDVLDEFSETSDSYSDLAKSLKQFVGLKFEPKSINAMMAILKETGLTVKDLKKHLAANAKYLRGDLKALHADLEKVGDAEAELIDNISKSIDNTHKMALRHGQDLQGYSEKLSRNYKELGAALNKVSSNKPFRNLKMDPQAAAANLKKVQSQALDKLADIKADFGFDSGTISQAMEEIQDGYNKISEYEAKIAEIVASGINANSKDSQRAIKRYVDSIAKETVKAHNKVNKLEEMGKANRDLVTAASRGYAGMLDLVEDTHQEFQRGMDSLKAGNFVEALTAFANSKKKAKFTGAVGAVAAKATGGPGGAAMGAIGMLGKLTGFINILGIIIKLLVDARNQAADMNKQLSEIYGLSDMGIDLKSDGYTDIKSKLEKTRNEIFGEFGNSLKFGVDSEEVMEALGALRQAGVTRSRIQKEGLNLREATDGVFAYAKIFGKSYGEMGNLMGKFAYDMSMGIQDTEQKFADIEMNWKETRLSIDDFTSTLTEITDANAIYGNRTSEVTRLLGLTGKNALLGGKQLLDAQKQFTGAIDNMDLGKFTAMSEMMGKGAFTGQLQEMLSNLQKHYNGLTDQQSQEGKDYLRRINILKASLSDLEKGQLSMQGLQRAALQGTEQDKGAFFLSMVKNYLMKTTDATASYFENNSIDSVFQKYQREITAFFFDGNQKNFDQQAKFLAGIQDKSGKADLTFDALMGIVRENQFSTNDLADINKKNLQTAATAASQMINSDKLFKIMSEQLLSKLYGTVSRIEDFIVKLLGLDDKNKNKENFGTNLQQANEEDAGSEKYQEKLRDALDSFFKFAADDRTSPKEVEEAFKKLTPEQQKAAWDIRSGNFKSLDKLNISKEQKENMVSKGVTGMAKLPKQVQDDLNKATGMGGGGSPAKRAPITAKLGGMLDEKASNNLARGGKLTAEEIAFARHHSQAQGMGEQAIVNPYLGSGMEFSVDAARNADIMKEVGTYDGYMVKSDMKGTIAGVGGTYVDVTAKGNGKAYNFRFTGIKPEPNIKQGEPVDAGELIGRTRTNYGISVFDTKGNKLGIGVGKALSELGILKVSDADKKDAQAQAELLKKAAQPAAPPAAAPPPAATQQPQVVTEEGGGMAGGEIQTAEAEAPNPYALSNINPPNPVQLSYNTETTTEVRLNGIPEGSIKQVAEKATINILNKWMTSEAVYG